MQSVVESKGTDEVHLPLENEDVLVGIPAYDEELSIGSLLLKLKKVEGVDDILVFDDGSDDDTAKVAVSAGAKVIRHKKNAGKGAAIKGIFDYARGHDYEYLVLMDADGQHNPHDVPHVLSPLVNPGADVVIGSRWGELTEMPLKRKAGKFVLDKVTPGSGDLDTQSGFRAFNRKAMEKMELTKNDFTIESEMIMEAREKGLKVNNARITCRYDDIEDPSTKGSFSHGLEVMNNIIRMTVERRPLVYLGIPGLIFYLAGLVSGVYVIQIATNQQVLSVGFSLLTLIFIIMGSIFITSGFILNEIRRLIKQEGEEHRRETEVVSE